jgi:hypothetical protein
MLLTDIDANAMTGIKPDFTDSESRRMVRGGAAEQSITHPGAAVMKA